MSIKVKCRAVKDRTGEQNINNKGCKMQIKTYEDYDNVYVEFKDKYNAIVHTNYARFKEGNVKNPFYPSVYGIGYLGVGKYKSSNLNDNKKFTKQYSYWIEMIKRGYSNNLKIKRPTYSNCIVCEEWHNFQNFGEWFDKNYYEVENYRMELDKDILFKGNKEYSPDACIFVPQFMNTLFIKSNSKRGDYKIGVSMFRNRYVAQINKYGEHLYLGNFDTEQEAHEKYKAEKESYITEIANKYKNVIPGCLYNTMINYRVEEND